MSNFHLSCLNINIGRPNIHLSCLNLNIGRQTRQNNRYLPHLLKYSPQSSKFHLTGQTSPQLS